MENSGEFEGPKLKAINQVALKIEEFKKLCPGYLSPEYERQFALNYESFLNKLELLESENSKQIVLHGVHFAKALIKSPEDDYSILNLLGLRNNLINFLKDIEEYDETFIRAVCTKDPKRFSNDPGVEVQANINVRKYWYEQVQLYKHLLAEDFVNRKDRKFTSDQVLGKYHLLRTQKKLKRESAHRVLIQWIESYELSENEVADQIGFQLYNYESFNKQYNRWLKK